MGTGSTFPGPRVVTGAKGGAALLDWPCGFSSPGNSPRTRTVPETDTGGLVEHTQAVERTVSKELGKLPA
jgi:hypothetical protein